MILVVAEGEVTIMVKNEEITIMMKAINIS